MLKKPRYTQSDLDQIDLEQFKENWKLSLNYMGNVAVKSNKIKILGIMYFDGKKLIYKCDPTISPLNFKIMGEYYKKLTKWIYDGKDYMKFKNLNEVLIQALE